MIEECFIRILHQHPSEPCTGQNPDVGSVENDRATGQPWQEGDDQVGLNANTSPGHVGLHRPSTEPRKRRPMRTPMRVAKLAVCQLPPFDMLIAAI